MSTITTRSVFYYGTTVEQFTRAIDFDEGGPELYATLKIGEYTLTEYAAEVQRAMRAAGTQAYVVTINRDTRALTISAPLAFTLRTLTGSRVGTSAWTIMGFSTATDNTGSNSYSGESGAGSEYQTQWPVDKYTAVQDSIHKEDATYSVTPLGLGQVVHFGEGARAEMDIRLITNLDLYSGCGGDQGFFYNPAGVAEFRDFISALVSRNRVEFMPDVDDRDSFDKLLLESTSDDRSGLRFELKNMKAPNIYRSGLLTFRKVLT